jgi:hypothetical protein
MLFFAILREIFRREFFPQNRKGAKNKNHFPGFYLPEKKIC